MRRFLSIHILITWMLLGAAVAGVVVACSTGVSDKPTVTVSIPPQKYIVQQIAGDKLDVKALLSQGANPETYEPSMSHLINLENSLAYLKMGNLGFEEAIISKVHDSKPDLKIYNLSEGVALIVGTHGHHDREDDVDGHNHDESIDPHTWSSVTNARVIAANALKALSQIDEKNAAYYEQNYNDFISRLDSLDTQIRDILAKSGQKSILIWHPSLTYFARDYGLDQIALGTEGKELSATELRAKIDKAKALKIPSLLLQRDFDSRQAEVVNKEIGAEIVYINPLSDDWEQELIDTARAVAGVSQNSK